MDWDGCRNKLLDLYQRQLAIADSEYLRAHCSTLGAVQRQLDAAKRYMSSIHGRVLDWGCMHAVDACLIRMQQGQGVELHGCDVFSPDSFPVFHGFAGLHYRQIDHPYQLPYPDNYFDAVIGDGVLEHVPNDYESLKELYRVLRPDGLFVLACLPNAWSYTEFLARRLGRPHHLRVYTAGQIRSMLLHSGFQATEQAYMQMVPTLSGGRWANNPRLNQCLSTAWNANGPLERCWPINKLASNLFVLARKRKAITWLPVAA